ncbi:MAG: hypothetical protein ACKO37_01610 [Vampirovibrionales bacterium]
MKAISLMYCFYYFMVLFFYGYLLFFDFPYCLPKDDTLMMSLNAPNGFVGLIKNRVHGYLNTRSFHKANGFMRQVSNNPELLQALNQNNSVTFRRGLGPFGKNVTVKRVSDNNGSFQGIATETPTGLFGKGGTQRVWLGVRGPALVQHTTNGTNFNNWASFNSYGNNGTGQATSVRLTNFNRQTGLPLGEVTPRNGGNLFNSLIDNYNSLRPASTP